MEAVRTIAKAEAFASMASVVFRRRRNHPGWPRLRGSGGPVMLRPMPYTRDQLMARLDELGIATTTREHPAVFTVEEAKAVRGTMAGAHSKNLFL